MLRKHTVRYWLVVLMVLAGSACVSGQITGTWVKAIPADMPGGNTVKADDGATSGFYSGPDTVWNPPTDKWYLWTGNGGIDESGAGGWNDPAYYCFYNANFNPPTIRTDITDLIPGKPYTVRVVYGVTATPGNGGVWAGLGPDPVDWSWYTSENGTSTGIWVPGRAAGGTEPDPSMQAVLGTVDAGLDGKISVWVGYGQTTFYDGVSYEQEYPENELLGTWVKAIPADMPNGNTVLDPNGTPGGWYAGPDWIGEDGWNPPTGQWYLWASNGGIDIHGGGGWNDADHYCIYNGNFEPPIIRTTLTGLIPGNSYRVRIVYGVTSIAGVGGVWAGLGPTALDWTWYTSENGSSTGIWMGGRSGGTGDEPWPSQQALLGDVEAVDGTITVWIGNGQTTFYDGLTYEPLNPCEIVSLEGHAIKADLNRDCYVNLADIAILGGVWLECIDPDNVDCDHPWLP